MNISEKLVLQHGVCNLIRGMLICWGGCSLKDGLGIFVPKDLIEYASLNRNFLLIKVLLQLQLFLHVLKLRIIVFLQTVNVVALSCHLPLCGLQRLPDVAPGWGIFLDGLVIQAGSEGCEALSEQVRAP